jgi:hypothetical protein
MRKAAAERKAGLGKRRPAWTLCLGAGFFGLWYGLLHNVKPTGPVVAGSMPGSAAAEARLAALTECVYDEDLGDSPCVAPDVQFKLPWNVYLAPQDNPGKGWRFFHLVSQGLDMHPCVDTPPYFLLISLPSLFSCRARPALHP